MKTRSKLVVIEIAALTIEGVILGLYLLDISGVTLNVFLVAQFIVVVASTLGWFAFVDEKSDKNDIQTKITYCS